jgi:outer membrane protein TolC
MILLTDSIAGFILIQTRMYFSKEMRWSTGTEASLQRNCRAGAVLAVLFAIASGAGWGQSSQSGSGTRAVQLPLSGGQQAGASVQQSAAPSGTSSVNTLSTQVRVQGDYAGSVLDPNAPTGTVALTLPEAIRRGLEFNLGKIGADAASRQAQAQRISERSSLLPTLNASVSENAAKIDLQAEGFSASAFGATGYNFPTTVGPFHYYDLRGTLQQNLLDLTAIHNYRSARQSADAAGFDAGQAREEVVLAVTGTYLQLMATTALIEAQRVEVQYAEASYKQARAQADAGNKAPIDANRSLVELQTEQQRLRSQLGDLQKQKNSLARLIGLPLSLEIEITEKLQSLPSQIATVEDAVRRSWTQRQDLKSAEAQLRAAEEARKAAGAEHLPSATVNGYYGMQGSNPNQGAGVFQASASLNVPIFSGGRMHADAVQADAVVTERRAELSNARGAVELDVRNAYIDWTVANDQVGTAESNRKLALATLQQSQDRFAVGVADSVEVVNSQEALAAADHDYVSSLFSQNLAKVALAHAMGEAEKDIPDLFKGSK